ncbi:MAG: methyltransferase domain-containing protein [Planctomycetia bacterium]
MSSTTRSRQHLMRVQPLLEQGLFDAALAEARLALTLAPYSPRALAVFETLLAQTQRAAARPLTLIISCEKHFGRAVRVSDRLTRLAGIDHRIVVGQTAQVPDHPRLMRVAAADDYESLPHKVAAAFMAVYSSFKPGTSVFKIDDDVDIRDATAFARACAEIVAGSSDYAGFVIGVPSHDRTWHWQKCRTEALNQQVYGKRYVGTWANGPFYYLSSRALRAFALAQIRFPAEIAGELYEDKFVGDTLRREGITATALDPATVGIAADNIEPSDAASPTTSPSRRPAPNTEIASIARRILDASDSGHPTEARALLKNALAAHPRAPELVALTHSIPTMYGHDFYAAQQAGSVASARRILSILREHYDFETVCDVGTGIGTWLRAAHELGKVALVGFDGPWAVEHPARCPAAAFFPVDLNEKITVTDRFDLVISVEVAEHLDPARGPGFVHDLCRAGDVVLFSAALPRQPGDGHVNCRSHAYWVDLFRQQGYVCLDLFRPRVWHDPAVEPWYAQNCFLFVNATQRERFGDVPVAALFDVYHPLMVTTLVQQDHRTGRIDPAADNRS